MHPFKAPLTVEVYVCRDMQLVKRSESDLFLFQFCDVAQVVIIHKNI
jgi:hypothetical protein